MPCFYLDNSLNVGSEGKLTVWNDRAAILEAIGCLEANSIGSSSSMENLVNIVVEKIIPYLQQEGEWISFYSSQALP